MSRITKNQKHNRTLPKTGAAATPPKPVVSFADSFKRRHGFDLHTATRLLTDEQIHRIDIESVPKAMRPAFLEEKLTRPVPPPLADPGHFGWTEAPGVSVADMTDEDLLNFKPSDDEGKAARKAEMSKRRAKKSRDSKKGLTE